AARGHGRDSRPVSYHLGGSGRPPNPPTSAPPAEPSSRSSAQAPMELHRPAMFGDVHAVALGIADPALGDRTERVRLRGRLRRVRDGAGALDLEAEVIDSPRLIRARDQGDTHEAVGQIDRAVGATALLLKAEALLVVIGQPFTIADIERDVSDPRFRHGHLEPRGCRSAGARSVPVGRGNEAGKLSPAQSLLRVLDAERMVDELDHVAVRIVK